MRGSLGPLVNGVPIYMRYIAVSGGALCADLGVYVVALSTGMVATLAAAIGYLTGVAIHWILSSRHVFDDVAECGFARTRQKALFLTSAFIGLGVTVAIVALATRYGLDARIAKLVAVGVSFQTTYLLRRNVVFA